MSWRVLHRRVEDFKVWKGIKFHACLCDPPYSLKFMSKKWDDDIAFKPDTWALLASHLLPGAFGMAFASARGWHRLACAIEDAGLRIHPSIFGWVYGSGFPKATRIDTQVDKRRPGKFNEIRSYLCKMIKQSGKTQKEIKAHLGYPLDSGVIGHWVGISQPLLPTTQDWNKMREILPIDDRFNDIFEDLERKVVGVGNSGIGTAFGDGEWSGRGAEDFDLTEPEHDLARAWAGHRYGLQALKPALEPIIVWQVPYDGKAVDSITRTGAGALNIEGGRIGIADGERQVVDNRSGKGFGTIQCEFAGRAEGKFKSAPGGRWPANFALQHHPDCRRVGVKKIGGTGPGSGGGFKTEKYSGAVGKGDYTGDKFAGFADADGLETIEEWKCVESCPVRRLDEQSGQSKSPKPGSFQREKTSRGLKGGGYGQERASMRGRTELEKPGYADKGGASRFFFNSDWSAEVEEGLLAADPAFYCAKAGRKERDAGLEERNPHPTIKALKLCRWLATLLLPPAAYAPRRLLVPFSGAGSEMVGAIQAGWEEVLGIESEREYVELAEARLRHWTKQLDNAGKSG